MLDDNETGPIKYLPEVWSLVNIKNLEEIADHCLQIMTNNEYIEYKII